MELLAEVVVVVTVVYLVVYLVLYCWFVVAPCSCKFFALLFEQTTKHTLNTATTTTHTYVNSDRSA